MQHVAHPRAPIVEIARHHHRGVQRHFTGNVTLELLGLPHPAYAHIPLLVAERDRRLSKRDRDAALDALLARFKTPEAVIGHIAGITGLAPACDPATPEELLATFDLAALPTTFDDLVQVRWR